MCEEDVQDGRMCMVEMVQGRQGVRGGGCAGTGSLRAQGTNCSSQDPQLCRSVDLGSPRVPGLQIEEAAGSEGGAQPRVLRGIWVSEASAPEWDK